MVFGALPIITLAALDNPSATVGADMLLQLVAEVRLDKLDRKRAKSQTSSTMRLPELSANRMCNTWRHSETAAYQTNLEEQRPRRKVAATTNCRNPRRNVAATKRRHSHRTNTEAAHRHHRR